MTMIIYYCPVNNDDYGNFDINKATKICYFELYFNKF
jgi:hypothetical protein